MKSKALVFLWLFHLIAYSSFCQQSTSGAGYSQLSPLESYALAICKEVEEKPTVNHLEENSLATLPIGLARETPSGTFIIAVDSAYSDVGGWFLSAYAAVILPGTTKPIAFAAKNIAFNNGGLTSSSQVKLMMISPQTIPVNDHITIELPADGSNFIEWDCNGFRSINIKGNFLFSSGLFIPDADRAKNETQVKASFEVNTADLNNILLSVSITPFRIRGLDIFSFEVKSATADFSDINNPAGFVFPQDYQQSFGSNITLWRGFYLQEVNVRIRDFADFSGNTPTVSARNLLIDDQGVSGWFSAANVLSLERGWADGWPISIDELSVKLMFGKLAGGALAGKLNIPFLGEEPLPYAAQMEQVGNHVNYKLSVATTKEKKFNTPFSATIILDKGSIISLEKRDGKLIPSTLLNGTLSVGTGELQTRDIKFERLGLTTRSPYITSGIFSTKGSGQSKAVGFPVRIDSVKLSIFQGEAGLGFGVSLNLMDEADMGFSASTFIQMLVKRYEEQVAAAVSDTPQPPRTKEKWKLDKVRVNDILLDCQTTGFGITGRLSVFRDDPVYGDGFRGSVSLTFSGVLSGPIAGTGYFGSRETFRYWHADVHIPVGMIPVGGPIAITGIIGGASYHMVRQNFSPDFTKLNVTDQPPGVSPVYVPDEKAAYSFMAGVTLVAVNEKIFNADAVLEIALNKGGGFRYAQFTGTGFFFTSLAKRERIKAGSGSPSDVPAFVYINMLFDNESNTFHANAEAFINLDGVIRGVGPNGSAGEIVIHADPRDWYFYIGRPSKMLGVEIVSLFRAKAYFMIGTKVESIPLPPDELMEVFNEIDPISKRDELALVDGRGFAMGVHCNFGFDTKDKVYPFYMSAMLGGGLDLMVRDYGNIPCAGYSDGIGINGWYGSGQFYLFAKGKVGIRVKGKNFDFLNLGAPILFQAKLLNPTWFLGALAGRFSVLGGLVKGSFHLKLQIGDQCEAISGGSPLDDITVIADMKPESGATEVNVFSAPQVSFNTYVESEFTLPVDNQAVTAYRIQLQEFSLTENGTPIKAELKWNSTKDVAILKTHAILPEQSTLKLTAKIYWEQKNANGRWEPVKKDGQVQYEVKESTFTTGTAPPFIPQENVAYSYPLKNQYNFHVRETGTGYLTLDQTQDYLFKPESDGYQWNFIARFTEPLRQQKEVPLTYDVATKTVSFAIPPDLKRQTVYTLSFVKRSAVQGGIDQNVKRGQRQITSLKASNVYAAENMLQGNIAQGVEKEIYSAAFRTSQFGTFGEKWASLNGEVDVFDVAKGTVAVIGKRGLLSETFDEYEIMGEEGKTLPLIQTVASPETPWMKGSVSPLLYDDYPANERVKIEWRETSVLGVKPLRGVSIFNAARENYKLTDANISSGSASGRSGAITIGYYLSYYSFWDYSELLNKAAAVYLNDPGNDWSKVPNGIKKLLASKTYTDLIPGYYPVTIMYSLPGINEVTFRRDILIRF